MEGNEMKIIKLITLALMLVTLATPASAETKGWGLGAGAHDGDFGVQVRKDFWLGGDLSQITGQASVYFPKKTTFKVDADYHFIINPESPSRFYPLVGLQFGFNSDHAEFGLNLGGGVNFMMTDTMAAFGEVKYVISDWDGVTFAAGVYF